MCGIVGVISKKKTGMFGKEVDSFSELLYADQLRGKDGTGVFFNPKRGKPGTRILKAAYKASNFLSTKEYSELAKVIFQEANYAIGHNRAATKGAIEASCTHPFRSKHITLVHNGTLSNFKNLTTEEPVNDSHAICCGIAEFGAKETLKKIDGAFALVWFDGQEKTLNLCRNAQRPLSLVETTDNYLIASEAALAEWIAKRNNLTIVKVHDIVPKKLYKFNIDDMSKFVEEDVEYKTFFYQGATNGYGKNTGNNYNEDYDEYMETQYRLPAPAASTNIPAVKATSAFSPIRPTKIRQDNINNLTFGVGDWVRFRAGDIKQGKTGTWFLEGDFLKYQGSASSYIQKGPHSADYENRFRIRVFDNLEFLRKLKGNDHLIGKVRTLYIDQGSSSPEPFTIYLIGDVRDYWQQCAIFHNELPEKKEEKKTEEVKAPEQKPHRFQCDTCYKFVNEVENFVNGFVMCKKCATESCGC